MKTFCAHCGNSMEYASVKPNFCNSCGTKMDGGAPAVASRPAPASISRPAPRPTYIEPEYDLDDIDLDSVAITASTKQGVKMNEIMDTGRTGWVKRKGMSKAAIKDYTERMKTTTKLDADDKG